MEGAINRMFDNAGDAVPTTIREDRVAAGVRAASLALPVVALSIAALTLVLGYGAGLGVFVRLRAGYPATVPETAVAFAAAAVALIAARSGTLRRPVFVLCSLVVLAMIFLAFLGWRFLATYLPIPYLTTAVSVVGDSSFTSFS